MTVRLTWDNWNNSLTNEFTEWLNDNSEVVVEDLTGNMELHGGVNDSLLLEVAAWDFEPEQIFDVPELGIIEL